MNKILILSAFMVGYLVNDIVNARSVQTTQAASADSVMPTYSINDIYGRMLTLEKSLQQHHNAFTEGQAASVPASASTATMKEHISDIGDEVAKLQNSLNFVESNLVGMANNLAFIRSNCRYRPIPAS